MSAVKRVAKLWSLPILVEALARIVFWRSFSATTTAVNHDFHHGRHGCFIAAADRFAMPRRSRRDTGDTGIGRRSNGSAFGPPTTGDSNNEARSRLSYSEAYDHTGAN